MGRKGKRRLSLAILIIALVAVDQCVKVWVKTDFRLHESLRVTDWFFINFIENEGMAYGMTIGSKTFLSLFRLAAVVLLGMYIHHMVGRGGRTRWLFLLALIEAGAIGNILDCMFYGLVFTASSPYYASYLVPFGTGYAPFLMGKVVDMFYFPLIVGTYPDWFPFYGGSDFVFFSPVFNVADSCISVGIVCLLLFCRRELTTISPSKGRDRAAGSDGDGSTLDASGRDGDGGPAGPTTTDRE